MNFVAQASKKLNAKFDAAEVAAAAKVVQPVARGDAEVVQPVAGGDADFSPSPSPDTAMAIDEMVLMAIEMGLVKK